MAHISLLGEAKELERQVGAILSAFDVQELPKVERELALTLRHQLIDIRLDAQEYEHAQTRAEQHSTIQAARKRLAALQETVVKASEYNLFDTVDVAVFSARIQQIISRLE